MVPSETSVRGREWRVLVKTCQAICGVGGRGQGGQEGLEQPAGVEQQRDPGVGVMGLELELKEVGELS